MKKSDHPDPKNELLLELRRDVLRWLKDTVDLIDETLHTRHKSSGQQHQQESALRELQKRVEAEHRKLTDLELRLVIAAPMSAGKSTIINAIVSGDVLPRRHTAMTVFPTEIVLDQDVSEPSLTLSPDLLKLVKETESEFRKLNLTPDEREDLTAENPVLLKLYDDLKESASPPLTEHATGHADIYNGLQRLNDLARLASTLLTTDLLGEEFTQAMTPRVAVPIPASIKLAEGSSEGRFVIVDTPGPNEQRANHLYDVLQRELEFGTIVLLVLDYTQLNTSAAADIKKRVDRVMQLVKPENLAVAVNKIDQRKPGDLTTEEVREMVAAKLGLADVDLDARLFEVAAERALTAVTVLQRLEGSSKGLLDDPMVASLLALYLPVAWEEQLESWRQQPLDQVVDELEGFATKLWRSSGFDRFLHALISDVLQKTGHEVLKSASSAGINAVSQIADLAKLQSAGLQQDTAKLRAEILQLQQEQEALGLIHEELEEEAKKKLNEFLDQIHEQRENWHAQVRSAVKQQFAALREGDIDQLSSGTSHHTLKLKNLLKRTKRKDQTLVYRDKKVANSARATIASFVKSLIENRTKALGSDFEDDLDRLSQEIVAQCAEKVEPVFAKAHERLNKTFDVSLSQPKFTVQSINVSDIDIKLKSKKETYQTTQTKTRVKPSFINLWGTFDFGKKETYTVNVDKQRNVYSLSLQGLEDRAARTVDTALDHLENTVRTFLELDFQNEIGGYLGEVKDVFSRYEDSLQAALDDQSKSFEERHALQTSLEQRAANAQKLAANLRGRAKLLQDGVA